MKTAFLSEEFYSSVENFEEIEQKKNRPYYITCIDGITYGIPFRSNIKHNYTFITDKERKCGLDFTKTVVLKQEDVDEKVKPYIRDNEFNALRGKDYFIQQKFKTFLRKYKKIVAENHEGEHSALKDYCTLKYFNNEQQQDTEEAK